jgi:hypothetical protein
MSFSPRQVLLLIVSYTALAVVWSWRLHANDHLPRKEATAVTDTVRSAVATSLAHAPKHLQQAALAQLVLLPDSAALALQAWQQAVPEQRLRQLTVQHGPVPAPSPLHTALLFIELTRADAPLLDDSRLLVSACGDRLDETDKIAALELLGQQALATNESSLALAIHERACESSAATWQNVLNLSNAARLARRPAAALRVVNGWLAQTPSRLDEAQREAALDLQITLLLEGGRYAEASRVTLDALRALKAQQSLPPCLMQRALLATRAAGESAELLPWIERQLRSYADHPRTLSSLASGPATAPEYRQWLNEGGCIADLNHQTSIACELFFRLAATGETRVLARLHALATQIGRGKELAQVLTGLQQRLSTAQVAQALADGGAAAAARALLAPHLQTRPDEREGWRLLTQIDLTLRGEAAAVALWEGFLKRFPGDVPALQRFARLEIAAAQYPQALRALQAIPAAQVDESTLRRIAALASQIDDIPAAHHAQQRLVASSKQPAVSDVLALASMSLQNPDVSSAEAARDEALTKLPAGTPFFLSLTAVPTTGKVTHFSMAAEAR